MDTPSTPGPFEALSAFVAQLATGIPDERALEALTERLVGSLSARGATVGLDRRGHLETVASHPATARELCELQHHPQGSPAATAFEDNRVLAVEDVSEDPGRWPGYTAAAAELGMRSVLSVPLTAGPEMSGAVSVVARERAWTPSEISLARAMTDLVVVFVSSAERARHHAERADQLQHALDHRVVVEQAKGVLAVAEGISVDKAYTRIRTFARSHNARVEDVAHAVVRLGLRPGG